MASEVCLGTNILNKAHPLITKLFPQKSQNCALNWWTRTQTIVDLDRSMCTRSPSVRILTRIICPYSALKTLEIRSPTREKVFSVQSFSTFRARTKKKFRKHKALSCSKYTTFPTMRLERERSRRDLRQPERWPGSSGNPYHLSIIIKSYLPVSLSSYSF